MKKIKRCDTCRGSKSIVGLGGIYHKCKECEGRGYAAHVDAQDEDDFLKSEEKPKRKYKKSKSDEQVLNV